MKTLAFTLKNINDSLRTVYGELSRLDSITDDNYTYEGEPCDEVDKLTILRDALEHSASAVNTYIRWEYKNEISS